MFGAENIMSNGLALRSLQEKVSLTLFVVMGALAILSYVTLQEIVAPAFDQLEYEEARTNLVRAETRYPQRSRQPQRDHRRLGPLGRRL